MRNTPSLPLFLRPLWPGVVVPVKVPSMSQIEQFNLLLEVIMNSKKKKKKKKSKLGEPDMQDIDGEVRRNS